jgi:hypothetical protein
MKSIKIELSDMEYDDLGLNKKSMSWSELVDIIGKKITKQTLEKSVQFANEYGLSNMSMNEINEEIKEYRNAKNNS